MAEAKKTVTRIVKGPKPIHGYDKDGKKRIYVIGDTIELTPNAAERFAMYLTSPEVAKAEAAVVTAKAAPVAPKPTAPAPTAGGGAKAS